MTSFTNTFGGSPVSPADVAYAAYSFSTSLTLFWPQFASGQTNVAARFMNLTATVGSLNVNTPDATLVSVGYDVIIFNAGVQAFNVVGFSGGAIATITTGQTYYILLTDNTTQNGTWQTVQFGVGTGSASAAALAGAGLLASAGLLEQNILGTTLSGSIALTASARAIMQVWNGGVGTVTLPSASSVGNGFFFPFANDGTGSVTVSPVGGDQIDGASNSIFSQTQSAFIVSTGTAWFTVGKGLQNNFSVTVLNLNVAGSSDVTETSSQAQSIIQQYTGILTGNINVIVPNTPQLYFVFNNTTGSYSLTVKTVAGTGVTVAQGTNTILYCDGTNVVGAFSTSIGTSVTLPVGAAGAPTLNFQGSTNTGLYSPSPNQIATTAGGFEVMNFVSNPSSVNYLQAASSSSGQNVSISALGSDSSISFNLVPKGSGAINITKISIIGGTIDGTVIGGITPAAISGTTIGGTTITGTKLISSGAITGGSVASTGTITGTALISTIATGTPPLTVTSTTAVSNLNIGGNSGGTTANAVTNSMLAQMAADTVKMNNTGSLANAIDATMAQFNAVLLSFITVKRQVFTSTGTYTPSTGMLYCDIEVWGGGGGGGGVTNVATTGGGGGGAGGYSKKIVSAATIGASKSVTIGSGGLAGTNAGGTGGTGGTTSVGSTILQATGGAGGVGNTTQASVSGGAGGIGSLGDINATGNAGNPLYNTGSGSMYSGTGAGTLLGGAGIGVQASSANVGQPGAANSGAGGSGAATNNAGAVAGGAGGTGYCVITEYCSQ